MKRQTTSSTPEEDTMTTAALLLAIHLQVDLTALVRSHGARARSAAAAPMVTCSIRVVGFRFEGSEGQRVRLGGLTYTIGRSRVLELISSGETTYEFEGKKLPLVGWPMDGFGFLQVPLPKGTHEVHP
jgi:hypothetical protein